MSLLTLVPNGGEFCVLRADIADRLIASGDGDGALLYLYLLRHSATFDRQRAMNALHMDAARFDRAVHSLKNIQIVSAPAETTPKRRRDAAPRYTAVEIAARRRSDHRFASVCQAAESTLGRVLSATDLKILYTAYDYLRLPADVLIDMLAYLSREKLTVTRTDIRDEAYRWADMNIHTADDAARYLSRRENEKPIIAEMLRALNLGEITPDTREYQTLSRLVRDGFAPDAIALAHELMLSSIHEFNWNYLLSILSRWHEQNTHTATEITAAEPDLYSRIHRPAAQPPAPKKRPAPAPHPQTAEPDDWELHWLKKQQERIQRREEQNNG